MKKLNVGSGKDDSIKGAITVDRSPNVSPDIVHDLNIFPWPFEDNTFDEIYCKDVIEHLDDVVKVMNEMHRIGKPSCRIFITTPHFSCSNSYTDPTHKHHLGLFSFDYFTEEHSHNFYSNARFKILKSDLIFHPNLKNKLIRRLAKKFPEFYEQHLTWMFPGWFMSFELEVKK